MRNYEAWAESRVKRVRRKIQGKEETENLLSRSKLSHPRWRPLEKKTSQALGLYFSSTIGLLANAEHSALTLWSSVSLSVNWVLRLLWGPSEMKHVIDKMLIHIEKAESPWQHPSEPRLHGRLRRVCMGYLSSIPGHHGKLDTVFSENKISTFLEPSLTHLLLHLNFPANTRVSRAEMISWGEPFCRGQAAGSERANTLARGSSRYYS